MNSELKEKVIAALYNKGIGDKPCPVCGDSVIMAIEN